MKFQPLIVFGIVERTNGSDLQNEPHESIEKYILVPDISKSAMNEWLQVAT